MTSPILTSATEALKAIPSFHGINECTLERAARAVAVAVIEHARDNVSAEMISAAAHEITGAVAANCCAVTGGRGPVEGRKEGRVYCECRSVGEEAIRAMITALLAELDGTESEVTK